MSTQVKLIVFGGIHCQKMGGMLKTEAVLDIDKIIAVDFKGAIEGDDLFSHLMHVHPASPSFENYFSKYTNHPHFSLDLKRRMNSLSLDTVDLVCCLVERVRLRDAVARVPALAYQSDDWMRYRIHLTLRLLDLSSEIIPALAWLNSDDQQRIEFCMAMFAEAEKHPAGFAEQWSALRKADIAIQHHIIRFLGRCPDARAIPFLKAYTQIEEIRLATQAVIELGRRDSADVRDFIEHLWKRYHSDQTWQKPLLVALRRIYLVPSLLV